MTHVAARLTDDQIVTALGDEAGRRILMACVLQARSVKDISAATRIPLTTVYRQIHRLESLGVLIVERSAMTHDGRKYDLYRSRVRDAHLDVDENGAHVRWTPNAPVEERLEWSQRAWQPRAPDERAAAPGEGTAWS